MAIIIPLIEETDIVLQNSEFQSQEESHEGQSTPKRAMLHPGATSSAYLRGTTWVLPYRPIITSCKRQRGHVKAHIYVRSIYEVRFALLASVVRALAAKVVHYVIGRVAEAANPPLVCRLLGSSRPRGLGPCGGGITRSLEARRVGWCQRGAV